MSSLKAAQRGGRVFQIHRGRCKKWQFDTNLDQQFVNWRGWALKGPIQMCVHIYNIVCKCFFLRDSQCGLFGKGQMAVECFCVLQAMFFIVLLSSVHARPPEFPGTHSPSSPEYCPSEQQKDIAWWAPQNSQVSSPLSLFVSSCVCPLDKSAWEMEIWGRWKIFSFPHYKQWV